MEEKLSDQVEAALKVDEEKAYFESAKAFLTGKKAIVERCKDGLKKAEESLNELIDDINNHRELVGGSGSCGIEQIYHNRTQAKCSL